MSDPVNHPSHYGGEGNPYEVIKVLEAWFDTSDVIAFCRMNAVKYLARAGKKSSSVAEDYAKAEWYARKAAELSRSVGG